MMVVAAAMWAGAGVVGRAAAGNVPPMTMAMLRWALALALLLPLGLRPLWAERQIVRHHWKIIVALGFFGVVGFTAPYYVALQFTPAINVSILNSLGPIMTLLIAFGMLGLAVTRAQMAGIGIALVGTLVIVSRGEVGAILGFALNIGDVLALASFLSWSFYTVMLRWQPSGMGTYSFLVAIITPSCLLLLPLYLWELHTVGGFEATTQNLFLIGYSAVFPSFVCYILWSIAVPVAGPQLAALSQYTNPVFGVIFAVLILGEALRSYHAVGIVAIVAGLYLSMKRRNGNRE